MKYLVFGVAACLFFSEAAKKTMAVKLVNEECSVCAAEADEDITELA